MNREEKRRNRTWLRWLMLLAALLYSLDIWQQVQEYVLLLEREVFSPAELAEIGRSYQFGWALRGLVVLGFLFVFATWDLDRKARPGALADSICLTALALLWAPVPLVLSLDGGQRLLWGGALLALALGAVWCWRGYVRLGRGRG